jgi:nitrile hydratase accessory protein
LSRNSERGDARLRDTPEPESPVFAASWEAEAFALAVTLSSEGFYSWSEWTETLGDELAQAVGETPDGSSYDLRWLAALERIAVAKGIVDEKALEIRKRQWIEAFGSTPHGQPVELRSQ